MAPSALRRELLNVFHHKIQRFYALFYFVDPNIDELTIGGQFMFSFGFKSS